MHAPFRASATEPPAADAAPLRTVGRAPLDDGSLSAQAIRLHALGSRVASRSSRGGLIGRAEAERLADRCGATVDELVDAGLWSENDLSYIVVALAV